MYTVKDLYEAYIAGFSISAEGFNGEYPFEDNNAKPEDNTTVNSYFNNWITEKQLKEKNKVIIN